MYKPIQLALCLAILTSSALSADSAILRNGFSIRHERRQVIGTVTRLYIDGDQSSFVDIPTAEIDHFESLPDAPTPASTPQSNPQPTTSHVFDLNQAVRDASGTYNLDPDLVTSVIRAESGFNVRAVSPKGAQGLMQLMPQTASSLGVRNALDPQANVQGGTRYLRELLERTRANERADRGEECAAVPRTSRFRMPQQRGRPLEPPSSRPPLPNPYPPILQRSHLHRPRSRKTSTSALPHSFLLKRKAADRHYPFKDDCRFVPGLRNKSPSPT